MRMHCVSTLIFELLKIGIDVMSFMSKMGRITGIMSFHFREANAVGFIICHTNKSYYTQEKANKYSVFEYVLSISQNMFFSNDLC